VAVGGDGAILVSTDGITWTKKPSPTTAKLTGVTFGNSTFVATGLGGVILQSGSVAWPSLKLQKNESGGISLALTGEIGRGYRIQCTTNIDESNWVDLTVVTNTTHTHEFQDTWDAQLNQRFYRAVSP
jgi:hypothetical protein